MAVVGGVLSVLMLTVTTIRFTFTNSVVAGSTVGLPLPTHGFVGQRFSGPRVSRVGVRGRVLRAGGCSILLAGTARVSFSGQNG